MLIPLLVTLALLLVIAYAARPRPLPEAAGGAAAGTAVKPRSARNIRVATYNIQGGKRLDGSRDLGRIGAAIEQADIVALQEVRATWFLGSQADRLARFLGYCCLDAPARSRWFHPHRGNALLSRCPILSWSRQPLPDRTGRRFRNLTRATVDVDGTAWEILFTHLQTRAGRAQQLRIALDSLLRGGPPILLLGDLNSHRDDPAIRQCLERADVVDGSPGDGIAKGPDQVDWILCRGLSVTTSGVTPAGASDHPCYWADLSDGSRVVP